MSTFMQPDDTVAELQKTWSRPDALEFGNVMHPSRPTTPPSSQLIR